MRPRRRLAGEIGGASVEDYNDLNEIRFLFGAVSVLFGGGDTCVIFLDSSGSVVNDSITDASRFGPINELRQLAAPVLAPLHVEFHAKWVLVRRHFVCIQEFG